MSKFAINKSTYIPSFKRFGVAEYLCLVVFAAVVLALLQYQYWYGENGRISLNVLTEQLDKQATINSEQAHANNLLRADVRDLKTQASAIEEHARLDLGLIKSGETFFQLSNAPVTYSRQMSANQEADAVEPVEGLVLDDGQPSQ